VTFPSDVDGFEAFRDDYLARAPHVIQYGTTGVYRDPEPSASAAAMEVNEESPLADDGRLAGRARADEALRRRTGATVLLLVSCGQRVTVVL
jgi:hypothetical protein